VEKNIIAVSCVIKNGIKNKIMQSMIRKIVMLISRLFRYEELLERQNDKNALKGDWDKIANDMNKVMCIKWKEKNKTK